MKAEPTGLSWVALGSPPKAANAVGGLVQFFRANGDLFVGQDAEIASDLTVTALGTTPGASPLGVVIGGSQTNFNCIDQPSDVGIKAASAGQLVILALVGMVYRGANPGAAAKALIGSGAPTLSQVASVLGPYQQLAGEVGVTNLAYPRGDVRRYGASTAGTAAANAAAINNASASAFALGITLYFPAGSVFSTNGNLIIRTPVMGDGCDLNWTGTGDAIAIAPSFNGVGTPGFVQDITIHLPRVFNLNKTGLGWAQAGVAGSVGVRVRHMYNCRLIVPHVGAFETGLLFYGEHDGCDYNNVQIGFLFNNKRNLMMDIIGTDSWTNENSFYTGRLAHDSAEGQSVAGVRQILILGGATGNSTLNNHRFRGLAFEGDVPSFTVETQGSDSLWDHCRWESNVTLPTFRSTNASAINNTIRNGFNSHLIQCTAVGGAFQPRVEHRDRLSIAGGAAGAVLALENGNSSASPIVRLYNAGQDLYAGSADTNWVWSWWAQGLQGKNPGDSAAKVSLDPTTGFIVAQKIYPTMIDAGGGTAVADGGGQLIVPGGSGTALVIVVDGNTGNSALVWLGTTPAVLAGGANFTTTLGTVGKYNVAVSGANLIIENRRGAGVADIHYIPFKLV